MCKHLLIATDGSSASEKSVSHGLALAKALAAQTTVIIVTKPRNEAS